MSESGVIPPPGDRTPRRAAMVGLVKDVDGASIRVGFEDGLVTIGGAGFPAQARLGPEQREEFSRLYFEAERQAEATMPP